ncbi:methyltransferase domain-containing protein [Paracoccus sp. p4-l81]|uniref:methyltransferase domain-containing protein n=1 Tax=unclassified Paracoccus (in: a-proteobacteria) TaxID=2688777 RepID=UPI0035BA4BFC
MSEGYYANANPDLLMRLPLSARRVLEIGCGEGALAARYRLRNPVAHLTGIEPHPPSAARARVHFDRLIEGDAEQIRDADLGGPFDLIVMGDALEHLADPVAMLRRLHGLLLPYGVLALSVPNIAHWSAIAQLIKGDWPDADQGLFDRTHRSFWTQPKLLRVLEETGFIWRKMAPRNIALDTAERDRWLPALSNLARDLGLRPDEVTRRAEALQYIVIAQRAGAEAERPMMVDIVARDTRLLAARGSRPLQALQAQPNVRVHSRSRDTAAQGGGSLPRAVVFQRYDQREPEKMLDLLARAMRAGWVCVLDHDDSPDLMAANLTTFDRRVFDRLLPAFHALQLSTPVLMEELAALHPERRLRLNALLDLAPIRKPDPRAPVRVFFGALNRANVSVALARSLAPVIAAHPTVEFVVVHDRAFHDALPTDRKTWHPLVRYDRYLSILGGCDIALMPLAGGPGEAAKSDLKFLEAAAQGVAAIVSPLVYGATVRDGETAIIARGMDDWAPALERLLRRPRRRRQLAERARAYVAGLDGGAGRMLCHDIAADEAWLRDLHTRQAELTAQALERSDGLRAAMARLAAQD